MIEQDDLICALSTGLHSAAIAIIRVSGRGSLHLGDKIFSKNLSSSPSHKLHFGTILNIENNIIDEVLIAVFHENKSFTGEEMLEINCHASPFIVKKIIQLLIKNKCRMARPGEFSMRAMLNQKLDLAQVEAIPDLINAETENEHRIAMYQMRGGFSNDLKNLRERIIKFASLLELELDFAEEDVEFANRKELNHFLDELIVKIKALIESFQTGNVIKEGIQVAIVGRPNAGKSTLLNCLLNEERAIVSDIPGTTRDTIEDHVIIQGVKYRFVDTAGLRDTTDKVESIGIQRAIEKMKQSQIIIFLFDINQKIDELKEWEKYKNEYKHSILVANKLDTTSTSQQEKNKQENIIYISAREKKNINLLKQEIVKQSEINNLNTEANSTLITNMRHVQCLENALEYLYRVQIDFKQEISLEFITHDLYQAVYHIGEITGQLSNDDILDSIFRDFCIGK